jgi:hypothetical protein
MAAAGYLAGSRRVETRRRAELPAPPCHARSHRISVARKRSGSAAREKLRESLNSIERLAPPADHDHVTTPLLKAFRNFRFGSGTIPSRQLRHRDPDSSAHTRSGSAVRECRLGFRRSQGALRRGTKTRVRSAGPDFRTRTRVYLQLVLLLCNARLAKPAGLFTHFYPRDYVPHNTLGLAYR